MNRTVRKYLRQVRKYLCCPTSPKREFLRLLRENMLLYCETQENTDWKQLTVHFGQPQEVAADFCSELDAKTISRFAYMRLRFGYMLLGIVMTAALFIVSINTVDYMNTQKWISGAPKTETYVHKDGKEYTRFWLKTNFRGKDVYWEYDSYLGGLFLSIEPEGWDGTEPYAEDIYFYEDGQLEHWTFGQHHMFWVRVFDV